MVERIVTEAYLGEIAYAMVERPGVSTTSPKPRYTLQKQFADLFDPHLLGRRLSHTIAWDTFIRYATEPDGTIALHKDGTAKLAHIGDMFIFEDENTYDA